MNLFNYTLHMKELDRATTLKEKERLARLFTTESKSLFNNNFQWGYVHINNTNNKQQIDEAIRVYRLLSRAIALYNGSKELPLFVREQANSLNKILTAALMHHEDLFTYDMYVQTYEFYKRLHVPAHSVSTTERLIKVIGNNPTLYTIPDNITAPIKFKITYTKKDDILYLEDIKYHLPSDITYTYIEETLTAKYDNLKTDALKTSTLDSANHLVTLATTLETRLAQKETPSKQPHNNKT